MSKYPEKLQTAFYEICAAIQDKIDWNNVITTTITAVVAAWIAAWLAYRFQKIMREEDNQKKLVDDTHRFNEAVAYLSVVLENVVTHLIGLVIAEFNLERKAQTALSEFVTSTKKEQPYIRLVSIRPLEIISPEQFLAKICDIGKHTELIQVFSRARNEMLQFQAISEERTFIIKEYYTIKEEKHSVEFVLQRLREINDRTMKLMFSGEGILDALMYTQKLLNNIADTKKELAKLKKTECISVAKAQDNPLYLDLLNKLREDIDKLFPKHNGRLLHMKNEPTEN